MSPRRKVPRVMNAQWARSSIWSAGWVQRKVLMPDKMEGPKGVADRLRAAREHAGLSQGQVAKTLEYHRPTISEIEAGRRKVSSDELVKFSKIYGVSLSWLVDEEPGVPDPAVELAARDLAK